jgi:ribosomal protein S18 acetylase RimI-like enzyme
MMASIARSTGDSTGDEAVSDTNLIMVQDGRVREVTDLDELTELSAGDLLCQWTAQGLNPRGSGAARAWTTDDGKAVAVACPALATKDRIAVHGSMAAAAGLLGLVLAEVGPTFRPIGDRDLIRKLTEMVELPDGRSLAVVAPFGWMDRDRPLDDPATEASWLTADHAAEVDELLDRAFPHSDARPADPDVERWGGIRDERGRLVATAALGWSSPNVGYIVGVAVDPALRGQGLAERVCRLVAQDAITQRGAVGLMVDDDNPAAQHLYRRLGFAYHPVLASHVQDRM